jgi:hypothetical protein
VIFSTGVFGPKPLIPSAMMTPLPMAYSGVPPGAE